MTRTYGHSTTAHPFQTGTRVALAKVVTAAGAITSVNKAAPFTIFRGSLAHAPMIAQCPLCIECRVHKTVELDGPEIFIADVVGTWTEARFLHPDGKPDFERMRPFVLSMPDGHYYAIGDHIADAWSAGRGFTIGPA